MNINTNTNLADKEDIRKVEDRLGPIMRAIFMLGIVIFPWIIVPNFSKSLELPREVFLFSFAGIFFILLFLYSLKKGELEWRRTKLNWIFAVWAIILGLLFLYSNNHQIAWEGFPGSYTGGLSEYLAFIGLYFLAVQFFSESEWKRIIQYFLVSVTTVLVFFILVTVYFQNNNILTINFARTPSLVAAASGVTALALWWILKRTESAKKGHAFVMVLALFFISSLLDFHLSWWMWVGGVATIITLDLFSRTEGYLREKDERTLGMNKERTGIVTLLLHGDNKYLFLIVLFALSRSLSPIFLGDQKLDFMPFFSYLVQYPLLGQKVFFYLILNFIVFCLGLFYFWKLKKERPSIILVLSALVGISVGHLLYYSESAIYFLLNWVIAVYAGLTFLRKAPERDYLYFLKPKSQGKNIFILLGTVFSIIILLFIVLRISSLF